MNSLRHEDVKVTRIRLWDGSRRILAFADLIVGPVKIVGAMLIRTKSGRVRLAFPERPRKRSCPGCRNPNPASNRYCGGCGVSLPAAFLPPLKPNGHPDETVSMVHPVDGRARLILEQAACHAFLYGVGEPAAKPVVEPVRPPAPTLFRSMDEFEEVETWIAANPA